jgi:hypothetical protein
MAALLLKLPYTKITPREYCRFKSKNSSAMFQQRQNTQLQAIEYNCVPLGRWNASIPYNRCAKSLASQADQRICQCRTECLEANRDCSN